MKVARILFITTSHDQLGDTGRRTGVWLQELAEPYFIFKEAGAEMVLASPEGGPIPVDPKSESIMVVTPPTKRFLKDPEAMNMLANSIRLEEVQAKDFDVVYLPGGHGPLWDIADNILVKQLLEGFNNEHKPIGLVCHGVVALLSVQDARGELLVKGKRLTAFSNSEEVTAGLAEVVPFLLQTKLGSLGALYSKGLDYTSYVVMDDNIITGQNPASSAEVAKRILLMLKDKNEKSLLQSPESVSV